MKNEIFNKAIDFLKSNESILELNNWKEFKIDFSNFDNKNKVKKEITENIEKLLGHKNKSGLYAVLKGNTTLYVGKANVITERLYDHYLTTHFKKIPAKNNDKYKVWKLFFSENANCEIKIKIFGIDGFNNNKILSPFLEFLEQIIINKEKIEFEIYRKNNKNS